MVNTIRDLLRRLAGDLESPPPVSAAPVGIETIAPVYPRVLLVNYDPTIPSQGGRRLSQVLRWNNTDQLVKQYIADIKEASYGYCNYQVVRRIEADIFPLKVDGFSYSGDSYFSAWRARDGFHQPDWANYDRILADFDVADQISDEDIDEVWLFAFPYGGFYESRMVGPGAFWCNAPPMEGHSYGSRRYVVMGFNYERGVGEMLEAFGHRAESIMAHVFRHKRGDANLWERFIQYDKRHRGQAEVGNVHYAPNSQQDYDWGNRTRVPSRCDTWYNFPDLRGPARLVDCGEWGNGDIRLHHLWWLKHFPHRAGETGDISDNWWEYVIDPGRAP